MRRKPRPHADLRKRGQPGKPISDLSMTAVLRRIKRCGIKDKAEAAYARSDLFDKRRKLMAAWEQKTTKTLLSVSMKH